MVPDIVGNFDTIVSGKDPHGNVLILPVAFVYNTELALQTFEMQTYYLLGQLLNLLVVVFLAE